MRFFIWASGPLEQVSLIWLPCVSGSAEVAKFLPLCLIWGQLTWRKPATQAAPLACNCAQRRVRLSAQQTAVPHYQQMVIFAPGGRLLLLLMGFHASAAVILSAVASTFPRLNDFECTLKCFFPQLKFLLLDCYKPDTKDLPHGGNGKNNSKTIPHLWTQVYDTGSWRSLYCESRASIRHLPPKRT